MLAACNLDLDAAVDCYGAFVTGTPPEGFPLQGDQPRRPDPGPALPAARPVRQRGQVPSPEQVDELERLLKDNGKTYEFHRYDNAGHGFFAVDRAMYRVEAANEGWEHIADFYATNLGG